MKYVLGLLSSKKQFFLEKNRGKICVFEREYIPLHYKIYNKIIAMNDTS